MRGRYEVEDLLKLRASPLVAKPPNLPPKEEWMGTAEPRARVPSARGKLDDAFSQTEGFQKRPSLLDSSRRSTTDPDRIHLGPPRHSFASSNARTRNGAHERTKTNEDDLKLPDRRTVPFGAVNGKFGLRGENENGDYERPRRRHDDDDVESRPKREYDRPRWAGRDNQSDHPWGRREKQNETDDDGYKDSPAWRRGPRDRDNERIDAEPEWVDAAESAEPVKAHTHEEFLQWMEKMKNKTSGEETSAQFESVEKETAAGVMRPPQRIVSDSSTSVDKFFAKFEEKKATNEAPGAARPTKSRFAAIFSPKEEPKQDAQIPVPTATSTPPVSQPAPPTELEQSHPPADYERKANDVAFAKLLEMLNKNQATSSAAGSQVRSNKSPANIAELATTRSPELGGITYAQPQSTRTPVATHTPTLSLDRLIESRSPAHQANHEQSGQQKATPQDLLDLLRRSNLQDKQSSQQQQNYPPHVEQRLPPPPPPGLGAFTRHEADAQGPPLISTRRENPRSIFDDPAFVGYRNEQDYQQRSPPPMGNSGPPGGLGGLFAAINNKNYVQSTQSESRPPPTHGFVNAPPGLQRPPGLDSGSMPPPGSGWPPNPQQRQPPHQYNMEPQQPLYNQNRNMYQPPQQHMSQPQPQPQSQPQIQHSRQMPQRKPAAEVSIPPGYTNLPPPGFGPSPMYTSPTSPDAAIQYAMRGGYGLNERERTERPQQQNPYSAMYGNSNRGGVGGVQLPPGFR